MRCPCSFIAAPGRNQKISAENQVYVSTSVRVCEISARVRMCKKSGRLKASRSPRRADYTRSADMRTGHETDYEGDSKQMNVKLIREIFPLRIRLTRIQGPSFGWSTTAWGH